MKAFVLDRYGSDQKLRLTDVPEPEVRDHDVLIEVHAAGVNALDAKIRNGEFKMLLPYRLPLVLGNDVAGVVVAVGAQVRTFEVGDEVYARPDADRIGTFAERIAIDARSVARKPARLTMEEAASVPLVGLTAWQALVERANVRPGQKVFIQAGSGGVGAIAIQLARHLGAVVATTTSTSNVDWVAALGAQTVIDYTKQDFQAVLRDQDLVLNSLGDDALFASLGVLKRGGKLISISGPPDPAFANEIGASWIVGLVMRVLSARITWRARSAGVDYAFLFMRAHGEQLAALTALIDAGEIRPVMDRVFPFAEVEQAVAYVESGRAKGKVVVRVR